MLNLRGVDLNLLSIFDALMLEENMTRAADRLGMSQPAMSAALQRLRLTFKDELFVRSRVGMQPTPRAHAIYPQIREALALIRGALAKDQHFEPSVDERCFRLLGDNYFEAVALGPLMAQLQQAGSGLTVEALPFSGQEQDHSLSLRRIDVDVVIDYLPLAQDYICSELLAEERLVVIASADHPRVQTELSLEQYLAEEHVFLPQRSRERSQLEQALGGKPLPRKKAAQVQNFSSMLPVVAATDYLAVMPSRIQKIYAGAFDLQCFQFPLPIAPIPIWMMWPAALDGDLAQQWFRGQLRGLVNKL
ncbi:LysR substrate-binding domain-containing protein [Zhongshania guokunii]|uniref:LysR substrate-binding domain-containing protein n=1 Tax=Zhongshania guokunii TaxID=641783 RepID=A0ABV3U4M9_9GAMM